MYNFLDPKLMPKVTCTSPATDNFEAENLINKNESIRARGYLAYTITKPPVTLDFTFICPVNIAFIYLNTVVGKQKCTGIEMFVKTASSDFTSVGKAVYDTSSLVFCNSRKYSNQSPPENVNCEKLFYFKSDTFRLFSNAETIRIVIFRTEKSVPCLGGIKVYGNPSKSCSKTTVETLDKIMKMNPHRTAQPQQSSSITDKKGEKFQVPEDFIDNLTYEIMAIPMTLPSGKTVDKHTLEKHIENEKSFGRKPGDPFTGLKFTEARRPILNIALKSRIDMFLLENSTNPVTFGFKRTVGSNLNDKAKRTCTDSNSLKLSELNQCVLCQKTEVLYTLPCKHLFCRNCLLSLLGKCKKCEKEFTTNQVERLL